MPPLQQLLAKIRSYPERFVREVVLREAHHVLRDIEWRYAQVRDLETYRQGRQVTAEDINDTRFRLTGYTVTANSPSAGQFAWASLHIVYQGIDYVIVDGNSGATNKYFTFIKANMTAAVAGVSTGGSNILAGTTTKPTLGADDILVFINNAGTPIVTASDQQGSLPRVIADGTVDAGAIVSGAVGTTALANNAVTSTQLADGAVARAAQLGTNVVTSTAFAAGAVTAPKLNILSHVLY